MTVVQLYEPLSAPHADSANSTVLDDLRPRPPRLARFIDGPARVAPQVDGSKSPTSPGAFQSATLTISEQSNLGSTVSRPDIHANIVARSYPKESDDNEAVVSLLQHAYPPASLPNSSDRGFALFCPESRSENPKHPRPIPATLLFARHAYPLSLPNLDRYLSSLVPPGFASKGQDCGGVMFPPLDKLENTGVTLDDLENNAKIPPAWRDRTGILWTVGFFFIDVLVRTT
jgi:hypothetical protein